LEDYSMGDQEKDQLRRIAAQDQLLAWLASETDGALKQMDEDPAALHEKVGDSVFRGMASALAHFTRHVVRQCAKEKGAK
jgi:hypothetical protein